MDRGAGNAAMVALGADVVLGLLLDGNPGTVDCLRRAAAARIHRGYSTATARAATSERPPRREAAGG